MERNFFLTIDFRFFMSYICKDLNMLHNLKNFNMKTKSFLLLVLFCALFLSCKEEKYKPDVKTVEVKDITSNSAIIVGKLVSDGGFENVEFGFLWDTKEDPSFENESESIKCSDASMFLYELENLEPSTEYFVRAYARNEIGLAYGEPLRFMTSEYKGLPIVETLKPTDITATCVTVHGNIVSDGGYELTSFGFLIDTNGDPSFENESTCFTFENSVYYPRFLFYFEHMSYNATYYVRTFARNEMGVAYGEVVSFTMLHVALEPSEPDGYIDGYAYVDLGLPSGLKWACYNVGGSSPEEPGDSYAWGEIDPMAECSHIDVEMEDISGNPQYDAATAHWGDNWRMPTQQECRELLTRCEWRHVYCNGKYGVLVEGPNGKAIFFSIYGNYYYGDCHTFYWNSTPNDDNKKSSAITYYYHLAHGEDMCEFYLGAADRSFFSHIRPVTK